MPSEFWAAIIGAVVGSVVGGFIAYLIQQKALNASSEQREQEAKERRQALGYALLFKMLRIHSALKHLQMHLTECLGKLEEDECAGWEPWQVTLPIANHAEKVHFSTDEMAMLLSLKNDDLFNDLASLDVIHNSTVELFRTFSSKREALLEILPANMNGMVGSIEIPIEQAMYIRPKMVELNALILDMNDRCNQDAEEAWAVLERLNPTLNEKLGLTVSMVPKHMLG